MLCRGILQDPRWLEELFECIFGEEEKNDMKLEESEFITLEIPEKGDVFVFLSGGASSVSSL